MDVSLSLINKFAGYLVERYTSEDDCKVPSLGRVPVPEQEAEEGHRSQQVGPDVQGLVVELQDGNVEETKTTGRIRRIGGELGGWIRIIRIWRLKKRE